MKNIAQEKNGKCAPAEPVVRLHGLTKVFRDFWGRSKVRAVDGLDLEILSGEVFGLLGPNGSGKSTTIKMVLGLLHPTSGTIDIMGKSPRNVAIKKHIGYLPEESYLYNYLTPRETLNFYARLFNMDGNSRRKRVEQLLEMVGLAHAADRPVGEFSKGMARRVGLAQALVNDPQLIILDEPTSGLDPIGCRQVKDLILTLAARGKTVVLSSHLLADVEDVCDRIAILYNGTIHARGHVGELLVKQDMCRVTMPSLGPAQTAELLGLIRNKFNADAEADHPSIDLEQFFLQVVERAHGAATLSSGAGPSEGVAEYLSNDKEDRQR